MAVLGGGSGVWFWRRSVAAESARRTAEQERDNWRQQHETAQLMREQATQQAVQMSERHDAEQKIARQLRTENEQLRAHKENNAARIAALETELNNAQTQAADKITLLQKAQKNMNEEFEKTRQAMGEEFKNLSQNILEEKSKKFDEDSQKLLTPLHKNIQEFRQRIDAIHTEETKERATLKSEIANLQKNAAQVGRDADNLARALKGDSKTQGDWGEIVLETLLEKSGLREGQEYQTQKTVHGDDGKVQKPDVIILLPDNKQLIVDSKVSLRAYYDYVNSEEEEVQKNALVNHVAAIKNHVVGLSDKHYAAAKNINSPDFVFMFMPVESGFFAALKAAPDLFSYAYDKKIVLCAPTTIMATLRTIAHIWRIDAQNKNAEEIARQGGNLYDKFSVFLESMEEIDKSLIKAKNVYDKANNQLRTGSGNLLDRMNKLHQLGINSKKPKIAAVNNEPET